MADTKTTDPARRRLFAGAGAAAALVAVLPRQPGPAAVATAPESPDQGGGYRLSEHVRRYYQTARV